MEKFDLKSFMRKLWKEWILPLGLAFVVAYAFRTTLASPRHIPTGSMIPTIKIGEFIFVKMYHYDWHIPFTRKSWISKSDPQPGDVVVFEFPEDPDKDYIKRLIGIPGDTIEVKNDRLIINGEPLKMEEVTDRSILNDLNPKYDPDDLTLYRETIGNVEHYAMYSKIKDVPDFGPYKVPDGCYFVMGDNRDDSYDSRYWGCVKREKFLGRAAFRWFSFDIEHAPFLRFGRFFQWVK